jgi:hypothetical protein
MTIVDLVERDGEISVALNGDAIPTSVLPMLISELSTAWALITELAPYEVNLKEAETPLTLRWHRNSQGDYTATDEKSHRTVRVQTTGRFQWIGWIDGTPVTSKGSTAPLVLARKRDMQRLIEDKL